ncbi:hypothetical protein [Paraburkholderia fungorum]|jgi:hypothetical protein|uniref:hypothetical protein n=1 Tax=Paraburkholderia fungorum TaxID=134537 RepID=UPI00181F5EE6|nr:hypothetical protein [Paraburkholderia fungorum]MBB5541655.1 hypothetical protein [Paraburkholderia fungorum]MBU7440188.1 hypothetical protein [Paraburkholderia fungorum]USU21267.1 hypothetical protein NFE55_29670 [Paraburkholderia fungorum]USU26736.1 hypothetical protein NFS19_31895 [Paraburkholderia fungorum]
MTAPQKPFGVTLKPQARAPRKLIEVPDPEARPDLMEAVRRVVTENREAGGRRRRE